MKEHQEVIVPLNLNIEKVIAKPVKAKRPKSAYPARVNKYEPYVLKTQNEHRMRYVAIHDFTGDKHCVVTHPETFAAFNEKVRALKASEQKMKLKKRITSSKDGKRNFWQSYAELQALKRKKTPKRKNYEKETVASIARMV
jgi:hypothetical protein